MNDAKTLGIGGEFFILSQSNDTTSYSSTGDPILPAQVGDRKLAGCRGKRGRQAGGGEPPDGANGSVRATATFRREDSHPQRVRSGPQLEYQVGFRTHR